jgi:hypothetical protein
MIARLAALPGSAVLPAFVDLPPLPDLPGIPDLLARTEPLPVSPQLLLVVVLIAAALAVPRASWRWFGLFTTLVHELGHAVAALLTGRLVTGIHVNRDHSGSAASRGRPGFGAAFSGFFGYPSPAIVGFALVAAVFGGYTRAALLVGTVAIVATLLFIRNLFGALVVVVASAACAALWLWATPAVQSIALLAVGVALLVGAVRGLATVVGVHVARRRRLPTSDAWLLAQQTGIPSFLWLLGFAVVIGACLWGVRRQASVAA